jgi:uncharacterized lipoprotein YmbA
VTSPSIRLAAALGLALLAGCASTPQESYYTLSAGTSSGAPIATLPAVSIAVSAASLNEAVDRPQLVTRLSETRVQILEQQRWAEPLRAGIPRVVAANLSRLLGTTKVWAHPQTPASDVAWRVTLDVQRFDSGPGDTATVEVGWTVRRLPAGESRSGRTVANERGAGGYDAMVAAQGRALETVSRDIAQAVVELAR